MAEEGDIGAILCAVLIVANEGETARGELHANLVRSARMETDFEAGNRSELLVVKRFEHFIVENSLFDTLAGAVNDKGFVFEPIVKKKIGKRCAVGFGLAVDDCEIDFLQSVRLHRGGKLCGGGFRARVDHHTADPTVETVDDPDVSAVLRAERIGKPRAVCRFFGDDADGLFDDEDRVVSV